MPVLSSSLIRSRDQTDVQWAAPLDCCKGTIIVSKRHVLFMSAPARMHLSSEFCIVLMQHPEHHEQSYPRSLVPQNVHAAQLLYNTGHQTCDAKAFWDSRG